LAGEGTDSDSERPLARRAATGDRAAFAVLAERHYERVHALAWRWSGARGDAEDIAQETMVKMAVAIRSFRGESAFSTWVYRIAINESLMILRKAKRIVGSLDDIDDTDEEMEPKEVTDWCCQPEETFIKHEVRVELDKAIQLLPEKLRVVFILRDMEDLSIRDTASALGITEMAVKTRLLRARLQLREILSIYFREQKSVKHE
jgi:RNA polymerase sigma-70 factor (ECF subfamily)